MSSISSVSGYSAYSPYQSMVKNVAAESSQNVAEDKTSKVAEEKNPKAAENAAQNVSGGKSEESGMSKMAEKIKELSNPNKTSDPQEVKTATQAIKEKAAKKEEAEEEASKNPQKSSIDAAQVLSYNSKAAMDLNVAPDKKEETQVKAQQEKSNKQVAEMYQQSAMQTQKQQDTEQQYTTTMFA